MQKRLSKNDIVFIGTITVLLAGILLFFCLFGGEKGAEAEITVDGVLYGTYSLEEDQKIPIIIDGATTNLLIISDGKADMTEADCPDQLCVHQKAIDKNNESIVCLPNKVVVRIISGEESEFDSIAK